MKNILVVFILGLICITEAAKILKGVSNYGIFGGQDAAEGQFPYQVSIQRCYTGPFSYCEHFCGGSIISKRWILTAGHCFKNGLEHIIVAGIVNRSEESDFKQIMEVNQTLVHADFIRHAHPHDIRLYQLKTPLVYNERVQPVALPVQDSNIIGNVIASGWGLTNNTISASVVETLQFQVSNMPDGETCLKLANSMGPNNFNITTNVCTENPEANHGICNGDSGGPLVQNGTIYGISSWGFQPCGLRKAPSVFTRVSNYIDWIKERVPEL